MCVGVPGEICEILDHGALDRMGKVRFGGIFKDVYLGFVPEAQVGDYVITHVGFAISRLDREQAQKVLQTLDSLDELAETEGAT